MSCENCELAAKLAACADKVAASMNPTPSPKPRPKGLSPAQESCFDLSWALYIFDLQLCKNLDPETKAICEKSAMAEYCRNAESCIEG